MTDKFLSSGGSLSLSNGSANLNINSLSIQSLEVSKPLKTNTFKQLVSNKLDINDITDLSTELSIKDELTFTLNDTHTNPANGIKIYAKTDGLLYKKDDQGLETPLAPDGYGLITIPEDELNDIDYKTDYDKTTWTNTSLDTYNFYNYYAAPLKPSLRTPFVPLDNRATNVFSEGDLDLAITDEKDNIFIATDFSITSSKFITFPCKIHGDSLAKPTITADGISTSLFNVSSDNVFFENIILENANTSSNCNCIYFGFNEDAKNNAVHNCVLRTNEFAINSDHYQVQIYNNAFEFVGTPDSHRYIYLSRCLGEVLIYENTFGTNGTTGSPNTACMLINSPNGSSAFDGGHLVIYKNNSVGVIQRMAIMETEPVNFKLSLLENTIETNTDFFILYGATMLNGFTEIIAYKNTVTLRPTSLGFKGLVGWDSPSGGGDITYCPIIRGSLNNLPSNLRVDYSPIPNLANILCYKNTVFTTSLVVPLNPSLVAFGEVTEGIAGPVSSVDNSMVFFDGTTGKALKENTNFKFITGATYGDQLKVPDIETDDHFSLNEELTTLDTAITTNTAKLVNQTAVQSPNPITTLVGELDVAKIKSYEHNCELQFDDTDATLSADGTVALTAPTVILNGSVNVVGHALSNQTSFTQDQQLITKKYVDDANTNQNSVISSNTAANIGSVTVHQDVSDAGSGAIITTAERNAIATNTTNNTGSVTIHSDVSSAGSGAIITTAERTAIGSNTTKTQNISATPSITTFTGTIGSDNIKATSEIAIGNDAGINSQGTNAIAIGNSAGVTSQGTNSVAIGNNTASQGQGAEAVSIGNEAGLSTQGESSIAIGNQSGKTSQGAGSISLGYQAGNSTQGAGSISLGYQAGNSTQGAGSISLGYQAGNSTQGTDAVAIGYQAGNSAQGQNTIAIGPNCGQLTQSTNAIAFGNQAAYDSQGLSSIAIGNRAGRNSQTDFCVAIGNQSGVTSQGLRSVAIGNLAGNDTQGFNSISIGNTAGSFQQKTNAVAIGNEAGLTLQGDDCIAIGDRAGKTGQVDRCVAIGRQAGETSQQNHAVAIGWNAGNNTQSLNSIAIGTYSGFTTQGQSGISIGNNAGQTNQGANSIAIGDRAGLTNQAAGSIILNATGTTLDAGISGTFIKPVREELTAYRLFYNPTTGEITYSA